jgi:hypothetical protein
VRVYFGREKGLALAREGVATDSEQRRCREGGCGVLEPAAVLAGEWRENICNSRSNHLLPRSRERGILFSLLPKPKPSPPPSCFLSLKSSPARDTTRSPRLFPLANTRHRIQFRLVFPSPLFLGFPCCRDATAPCPTYRRACLLLEQVPPWGSTCARPRRSGRWPSWRSPAAASAPAPASSRCSSGRRRRRGRRPSTSSSGAGGSRSRRTPRRRRLRRPPGGPPRGRRAPPRRRTRTLSGRTCSTSTPSKGEAFAALP